MKDEVLLWTTVYNWFKKFKKDRESLDYDECSGSPISSRVNESVKKNYELIKKRCLSTKLIENVTGVRKSEVYRILNEYLKLRNVCARFGIHILSQKL